MRAPTIVVLTCLCVFAGSASANLQGSRQTIQASEQSSSSSSSSQQSSNAENSSSRTETDGSSGKTVKSAEQSSSSNNAAAQQSSNSKNSSFRTETSGSSGKIVKSAEQSSSSNNAASQQSSNSENSSSRTETGGSSIKTSQSSQASSSSKQASQQSSSSSSSSTEYRTTDVETAWNNLSREDQAAFQKWLSIRQNTKDKGANVDEFDDDDDIKGALIRYRKRFPMAIKKGEKGIELNFNLKTLMYSDLKSGDNQCICSCKNSKKPYIINVDQQKAED